MDVIKIKSMGGIKCDNPNCNYRDDNVTVDEYPDYINRPCPLCGCNLLTDADYESFMKTMEMVQSVNRLFNRLPKFITKRMASHKDDSEMLVDFNGTGKVDIKIKEIK